MKRGIYQNGKHKTFFTEADEVLDFTKENIDFIIKNRDKVIEKLKKENELLRNNEYVKERDAQIEKLLHRLGESFEITPGNKREIEEWKKRHLAEKHPDMKYMNCYYEFHPTEIVTIGYCVCDTCKEKKEFYGA